MDENERLELQKRFDRLIAWLSLSGYGKSDNDIAKLIGYAKPSFAQYRNGRVNLAEKFLNKLCAIDKNINKEWIRSGKGQMLLDSPNQIAMPGIPLIPNESVTGFSASTFTNDEFSKYVIPEFMQKGADYAIRISGSEMYPKFSSGDIVACRKIPEILFFQWGKVYVMETSQGMLLKRVQPCDDENFILCVSENKDEYPSFKLPKSAIQGCSIVLGLIHIE